MKAAHVLLIATALATAAADTQFVGINGLLCIRSEFVETHALTKSELDCSLLCHRRKLCQAFSMADGPCQLFVFDKCSKYVRDCSCTRRAQVFVRQQPGLPPGALCPAGYADDLCGTKYKLFAGFTDWNSAKAAVDMESGLVIMADVTNNTDMMSIKSLFTKYSWSKYVILGGRQLPGSAEPAGGWYWVSCNTSISSSLWNPGEPNNSGGNENTVAAYKDAPNLFDIPDPWSASIGALAECVSPFN